MQRQKMTRAAAAITPEKALLKLHPIPNCQTKSRASPRICPLNIKDTELGTLQNFFGSKVYWVAFFVPFPGGKENKKNELSKTLGKKKGS